MNRRHTFPLTLTALAIAAAFPSYAANPETAASDAAQSQSLKKITVRDRKSTRLNSSHLVISYAVFCLKKKKNCHKPQYQV